MLLLIHNALCRCSSATLCVSEYLRKGLETAHWFFLPPIISYYYMALDLSHKDWELPNSRIWLAEIDIDRGLDFPIQTSCSVNKT